MDQIPDGYERHGEQGLRLIDPLMCPAGHEFIWGTRQGVEHCGDHQHPWWRCGCGQRIYRAGGAFVGELDCG